MPIVKRREIEMVSQLNGEELERFLDSLPLKKRELESLFEYLEDELETEDCDHTARFAIKFMMIYKLPFPKILAWLNKNGGYCDCKILANIETEWRKAFPDY